MNSREHGLTTDDQGSALGTPHRSPRCNRAKTHPVGDVVNNNRNVYAAVIERRQRSIFLLTSGVPDIEFYTASGLELKSFRQKRCTNGRLTMLLEMVADKPNRERALSDARFSNHHN